MKFVPKSRILPALGAVCALALAAGCSSNPPRNDNVYNAPVGAYQGVAYGHVSRIEVVPVSSRSSGAGAILGAVVGGVLGNQVGSGSGRDAATVVGALGGAAVGNQVERRNKGDDEVYRVTVRLDNGSSAQFDYRRIDDLRVGDRIKVQDGQLHRV
jgi:outer membrane lipoprotein SlyB